jgi:branched-chain amino acid transport system ATP-binding protein
MSPPDTSTQSLDLHVQGVSFSYGGARALDDVTLSVPEGQVVALLGSNGAGKTTMSKVIAGALPPRSGTIRFGGEDIAALGSHRTVRKGVVLVPEGRLVFPQMTIEENLLMGAYKEPDRARIQQLMESVYTMFPRLRERRSQFAGSLSGGEQQMLAIGRGLMAEPKLLILDEPSLGIMPKLVKEIFQLVGQIAARGVSVLMIEQNARASLEISSTAYVLDKGRVILQGKSSELLQNRFVQEAYLGVAAH